MNRIKFPLHHFVHSPCSSGIVADVTVSPQQHQLLSPKFCSDGVIRYSKQQHDHGRRRGHASVPPLSAHPQFFYLLYHCSSSEAFGVARYPGLAICRTDSKFGLMSHEVEEQDTWKTPGSKEMTHP